MSAFLNTITLTKDNKERRRNILSWSKDMIWGAASAAYQVEGAFDEDGKGLSIWDALSDGHVKHNDNGNIACDQYHLYKEDIALMKRMNLQAYRFSISWPRIMPEEGVINPLGVQYYKNLVEEIKKAGDDSNGNVISLGFANVDA